MYEKEKEKKEWRWNGYIKETRKEYNRKEGMSERHKRNEANAERV
jgi:hypothetical protein